MSDDGPGLMFLPAAEGLRGAVRVPGDKSISHRALLFGAVNGGPLEVTGFLRSADTLATLAAVRALGVTVDDEGDTLVVHGAGWEGLKEPGDVIDVANSGTLIRLLPGVIAGRGFLCVLTGDASIRRRPMGRILAPLSTMGVSVWGRRGDSLPPIGIRGGVLSPLDYTLPIASAQVKSCLILAALQAEGESVLAEPAPSRDHTELLVRAAGGRVEREGDPRGPGLLRISPLHGFNLQAIAVPGDISSAAFFVVAALLVPGSEIAVTGVGLNPTRTGLLHVLERMGARLQVAEDQRLGAEPTGTITARTAELSATDVSAEEVPSLIDELPLFLLAAAKARGVSHLRGAGELRAKESDRLQAMAELLRALGVAIEEHPDGLDVTGRPEGWSGGSIRAHADHRLAMVGAVAGAASREGVLVDDVDCMKVSYPGFTETLAAVGGTWKSRQSS